MAKATGTERVADFFEQFAWKHLRMVDLPHQGSNQHEVGGVAPLREMLGTDRRDGLRTRWRIFDEEGELVETVEYSDLTWYDCREGQPHRGAEWRLYYPAGETPLDTTSSGDLLLMSKPGHRTPGQGLDLLFYVIPQASSLHNEVLWALGLGKVSSTFQVEPNSNLKNRPVHVLQREVLQTLEPELNLAEPEPPLKAAIMDWFGEFLRDPENSTFPSTTEFATFAHQTATIRPVDRPDNALMQLLDVESRAFYELEEAVVNLRLDTGFEDVSDFISFSLSVQNRRKARRGRSLENHLAFVFSKNSLRYEEQVRTESSTVDFLFPDEDSYRSFADSGEPTVMMLAAKSSCKDRWRQVLNEALALDRRHLFTLEAAISSNQTGEMGEASLSLVVPQDIVDSFIDPGTEILILSEFIEQVRTETDQK